MGVPLIVNDATYQIYLKSELINVMFLHYSVALTQIYGLASPPKVIVNHKIQSPIMKRVF